MEVVDASGCRLPRDGSLLEGITEPGGTVLAAPEPPRTILAPPDLLFGQPEPEPEPTTGRTVDGIPVLTVFGGGATPLFLLFKIDSSAARALNALALLFPPDVVPPVPPELVPGIVGGIVAGLGLPLSDPVPVDFGGGNLSSLLFIPPSIGLPRDADCPFAILMLGGKLDLDDAILKNKK